MQQAARVSDRTAYFHLGDLIEVNSTEKVFTQPDHQLTEAYITGAVSWLIVRCKRKEPSALFYLINENDSILQKSLLNFNQKNHILRL